MPHDTPYRRTTRGALSALVRPIARYAHWLHIRWPAGTVERLPEIGLDGRTNVPGVFIAGDLTGIPLLKFAVDSGARAAMAIAADLVAHPPHGQSDAVDLAIVGGGVSGIAAAIEAKERGLSVRVYEAARPFATVHDFPVRKPIFTFPRAMVPAGRMQVTADVKEDLVAELERQRVSQGIAVDEARIERIERSGDFLVLHRADGGRDRARRVLVAVGRSGDFRRLGVPGEDRDTVHHRLHDPADFSGKRVLVVGGGDAAIETAIALVEAGAHATLAYRREIFSRPKRENVARLDALRAVRPAAEIGEPVSPHMTAASTAGMREKRAAGQGTLALRLGTEVREIRPSSVVLSVGDRTTEEANDAVFAMIGRDPPLDFLRRSGIAIRGERTVAWWTLLALFPLAAAFVVNWKAWGTLTMLFRERGWFPFGLGGAADPSALAGTVRAASGDPGFWFSVAYSVLVVGFGIARVRRRRTPYVAAQTAVLAAVQVVPLFLLPYIVLPWLAANGAFDAGAGRWIAENLFPGESWWRAFGLVLAWPLFVANVFTGEPLWIWLAIAFVQTFVLIPAIVYVWGKGAYCGWICSCGALAETFGDRVRYRMPHGPGWNRLNMAGQAILLVAFFLLGLRIAGWTFGGPLDRAFAAAMDGTGLPHPLAALSWKWLVDATLAGIVGLGLYWHASGRVWCRFFCPLAALMHVYARFSRYRIFAAKERCISCNVCTAACHQGIDVMSFANKGLPMDDPQCVRCSACVEECPTGVLAFGRISHGANGKELPILDRMPASPVRMRERIGTGNTD